MDFRRITETNPEDNCDFYNQQRLRCAAKETKRPVIAFDAVHENCTQRAGLALDDDRFMNLPKRLELCVGAPVLLTHNLAPQHGLMNGSQGTIEEIQYPKGGHPNHERPDMCMPCSIIINFPDYVGPAFFELSLIHI